MIHDFYPPPEVEVWALNKDAGLDDWLLPYRIENNLHLPIMQHADAAFDSYRVGRTWRVAEPLYIVIDKRGLVRLRRNVQGSVSIEEVADLVNQLLEE